MLKFGRIRLDGRRDGSMNLFIISFELVLFVVPIINILLFMYYRKINKKWQLDHLWVSIALFIIELMLYINMYISPVNDGGVFVQAFLAWMVGVFAGMSQIITINTIKVKYGSYLQGVFRIYAY